MDNGAPPTDDVASTRSGAAGSTQLTPPSPATNGATNGSGGRVGSEKNGSNGAAGRGGQVRNGQGRNGAARKAGKKATPISKSTRTATPTATPTATRSHAPAAASQAAVTTDASPPVDDVAAALASVPMAEEGSLAPLVLPTIVPADTLAPPDVPAGAPSGEPVEHAGGDLVTITALVPSVGAPSVLPPPEFSDTDGTDGLPSLLKPKKAPRPLKPPVVRSRRRPRVRRVTRVVRHVDTWSVFKVAVIFNLFLYAVCLTAGVLLWRVAQSTGTVDNVERFFESFGWERFELKGGEIYHSAWIAGLFVVVGLTGLAVLMATMFNLITDLVGGVRVSVLEEEVVAREDRGLGFRRGRRRAPQRLVPPNPVE